MSSPSEQARRAPSLPKLLLVAARLLLIVTLLAGAALSLRLIGERAAAPRHFSFVAQVSGPSAKQTSVPVAVYVPSGALGRQPLTVLLALHGVGGNGDSFAYPLFAAAEQHGWVVVAPTFAYDGWLDVSQLTDDDVNALAAVQAIVHELPGRTGLRLNERLLLYGFSRGAQLAHRFALLYPDKTLAVAALSAGAYTLPEATSPTLGDGTPLNWPLGIADVAGYVDHEFRPDLVRQVRFFVGVGTRDTQERDVPRAWDRCSGTNRVARAIAFAEAVDALGAPVELVQFPNAGHQETAEMRRAALEYLAGE